MNFIIDVGDVQNLRADLWATVRRLLQEAEYAATVSKLSQILEARRHAYELADLHIPLETSPTDPGDCGAAPAVVAYRYQGRIYSRGYGGTSLRLG